MKEIIQKMRKSDHYLIMSVGDSLTEGQRASGAETTYTAVLARGLAERFLERTVVRIDGKRVESRIDRFIRTVVQERPEENGKLTVVRSGYGGNTVRRLLNRKEDFVAHPYEGTEPDLFLISVGINDSIFWVKEKFVTPLQYREDLLELLNLLHREHPKADVVFITPSWYAYGSKGTDIVGPYAAVMLALAEEEQVPCLDMHGLWQAHFVAGEPNFGHGDWLYDGDRAHPGDVGHAAFGDALLKFLFEE